MGGSTNTPRWWKLLFVVLGGVIAGKQDEITVHVCPHSHTDPGWLMSFEQYYVAQSKDPQRRFTWADMAFLLPWLEHDAKHIIAHDAEKTWFSAFITLIRNRQLQLVNCGFVQHDEALTSTDEAQHQLQFGRRQLQQLLPSDVWKIIEGTCTTAYHIDTFGHSQGTADFFRRAGYTNIVLNRVARFAKSSRHSDAELEFWWLDSNAVRIAPTILNDPTPVVRQAGSARPLLAHILHEHYSFPAGLNDIDRILTPGDDQFAVWAADLMATVQQVARAYRSPHIMLLFGDDFRYQPNGASTAFANIDRLLKHLNADPQKVDTFNGRKAAVFQYSTPPQYFKDLTQWALAPMATGYEPLPAFFGSFMPYEDLPMDNFWTGYYSNYPRLKRAVKYAHGKWRLLDTLLTSAITMQGQERQPGRAASWSTWRAMCREERLSEARALASVLLHHDAITGTSIPSVMDDYMGMALRANVLFDECIAAHLSCHTPTITVPAEATHTGRQSTDVPVRVQPSSLLHDAHEYMRSADAELRGVLPTQARETISSEMTGAAQWMLGNKLRLHGDAIRTPQGLTSVAKPGSGSVLERSGDEAAAETNSPIATSMLESVNQWDTVMDVTSADAGFVIVTVTNPHSWTVHDQTVHLQVLFPNPCQPDTGCCPGVELEVVATQDEQPHKTKARRAEWLEPAVIDVAELPCACPDHGVSSDNQASSTQVLHARLHLTVPAMSARPLIIRYQVSQVPRGAGSQPDADDQSPPADAAHHPRRPRGGSTGSSSHNAHHERVLVAADLFGFADTVPAYSYLPTTGSLTAAVLVTADGRVRMFTAPDQAQVTGDEGSGGVRGHFRPITLGTELQLLRYVSSDWESVGSGAYLFRSPRFGIEILAATICVVSLVAGMAWALLAWLVVLPVARYRKRLTSKSTRKRTLSDASGDSDALDVESRSQSTSVLLDPHRPKVSPLCKKLRGKWCTLRPITVLPVLVAGQRWTRRWGIGAAVLLGLLGGYWIVTGVLLSPGMVSDMSFRALMHASGLWSRAIISLVAVSVVILPGYRLGHGVAPGTAWGMAVAAGVLLAAMTQPLVRPILPAGPIEVEVWRGQNSDVLDITIPEPPISVWEATNRDDAAYSVATPDQRSRLLAAIGQRNVADKQRIYMEELPETGAVHVRITITHSPQITQSAHDSRYELTAADLVAVSVFAKTRPNTETVARIRPVAVGPLPLTLSAVAGGFEGAVHTEELLATLQAHRPIDCKPDSMLIDDLFGVRELHTRHYGPIQANYRPILSTALLQDCAVPQPRAASHRSDNTNPTSHSEAASFEEAWSSLPGLQKRQTQLAVHLPWSMGGTVAGGSAVEVMLQRQLLQGDQKGMDDVVRDASVSEIPLSFGFVSNVANSSAALAHARAASLLQTPLLLHTSRVLSTAPQQIDVTIPTIWSLLDGVRCAATSPVLIDLQRMPQCLAITSVHLDYSASADRSAHAFIINVKNILSAHPCAIQASDWLGSPSGGFNVHLEAVNLMGGAFDTAVSPLAPRESAGYLLRCPAQAVE